MTGEYYATTGLNHQTRIGSFHYPGCTTVGNGTLSGTVTDGANPISGATVTLGSRTTTTNGSGQYSFTRPGRDVSVADGEQAGLRPGLGRDDRGSGRRHRDAELHAQRRGAERLLHRQHAEHLPARRAVELRPRHEPGQRLSSRTRTTRTRRTRTSARPASASPTRRWAGQTFTPTVTGQLKRVDVELFCSGCTATNPNITLSIRNTTRRDAGADRRRPRHGDAARLQRRRRGRSQDVHVRQPGHADRGHALRVHLPARVRSGRRTPWPTRAAARPPASRTRTRTRAASSSLPANSGSTWTADTTVGGRDLNFVTYINPGFAASGTFVSSLKDANPAAGRTPNWTTLTLHGDHACGHRRQVPGRASNSAAGPFSFVGPDGTAATFFTTSGASLSQFNGFRYLKYKAILSTTNGAVTPTLSSVQVCFDDAAATSATSLAVAPATGTFGGTTTLSATLTSGGAGVRERVGRVHAQRHERRQRDHERAAASRRSAASASPGSTRARTRPASAPRSRATLASTRAAARAR